MYELLDSARVRSSDRRHRAELAAWQHQLLASSPRPKRWAGVSWRRSPRIDHIAGHAPARA